METGNLSINSENIFPIIKKWLYSDVDIFVRELISNAADATTKLKRLAQTGETELPDAPLDIRVRLDAAEKTISFTDMGIGMTGDEIKKYINQIAFSGATEFLEKYQGKDEDSQIIGHFGLGFYSAFMAAEKVTIDSLSYQDGAEAAHWECDGGVSFSLDKGGRAERGTTVTLHIGEDNASFLDDYKLRGILRKYCGFVPYDIYFENAASKPAEPKEGEEAPNETPINDKAPLWLKKPGDCADDEYKAFYRKVFTDFNEPLFWIHLNMDYPFRLKGILYFPKLKHDLEAIEGQVKLYNSQIFIADNIKEVVPEFLLLLKGVIDCPDLPLNVSRSFLQNDGYVEKVSGYITKKVADKLTGLYNTERERYEGCWEDIAPFVKYGCIREEGFYDKVKPAVLYKKEEGGERKAAYATLDGYLAENEPAIGKKVYYVSSPESQAQYVKLLSEQGIGAVLLNTRLDTPFISFVESKEEGVAFERIDSAVAEAAKGDKADGADDGVYDGLKAAFKAAAGEGLTVEAQPLKSEAVPAVITLSEQTRRMREMGISFGLPNFGAELGEGEALIVNTNSPLVKRLAELAGAEERKADAGLIAAHIYDLALMSHKPLTAEQMAAFMERSNELLARLAQ